MNKQTRLATLGLLLGVGMLGIGVAYESLWCERGMGATAKPQRLARDGITVDFKLDPVQGGALVEGQYANISFNVRDQASGEPLRGAAPGAWLDATLAGAAKVEGDTCKARAAMFLKSSIGARPLLDLNSYFLLVMNQDASLSVIDPAVSVGGVTSTKGRIELPAPAMDWVANADDKWIYASLPETGEVAVIDTQRFALAKRIDAGERPVRTTLQPGGRWLWVGNDARHPERSGVTLIDTRNEQPSLFIATGAGHHEIAFAVDGRRAFVSNRDAGTLSVIDTQTRQLEKTLAVGGQPLSVAASTLARAIYVADGQEGRVHVIDEATLTERRRIDSRQGIGPMGFTPDGRYALVLNTLRDRVVVIDAASDTVIHEIEVAGEPFQLSFTEAYAYVRGLSTPRVTMINLGSLGQGREPIVQGFEAGPAAPRQAGDLPLAAGVAISRDANAVYVVNPSDNTTYFYAEGMNAPMSAYLNRGQQSRAVKVIDHSLREDQPGVYGALVRLPAAGQYDVAFLLNQPQVIHCFAAQVEVDPSIAHVGALKVEFLPPPAPLHTGSPALQVRLLQGDAPRTGVQDLRLRYYRAPTSRVREVPLEEVGNGLYQARVELAEPGAWYLHARSASLGQGFGQSGYASVRVIDR